MKASKAFRSCYLLTLAVFLLLVGALSGRLAQLHRAAVFYEQLEGGASAAPEGSSPPAVHAPPEGRGCTPVSQGPHPLSLRLSRFAGECPDTAAWLQLPGTPLDYPVMLGADNQFYLNHLPDGSKNALGSLFLDCRTEEDSPHLIVYGHNGTGGTMFGLLERYESRDYYSEHKALTLATADRVYVCPIFSVRRVEAGSGAYNLKFEGESSLTGYIDQAAAESLYSIDVVPEGTSKILTLSTCTGRRSQRLVVQALIERPEEPE